MVKDSNFQLDHIKKVSKLYTKSKKVTDIYRLLTPEYQEFNDTVEKVSYSNDDFLLCTPEEKAQFVNTELITFESVVCNTIYEKYGIMHSWIDVFNLMQDPIYKTVEKINRKVIYSSMVPNRPIGDTAFDTWNGLQIIDLDIKEATIADALKPIIFNELKKYTVPYTIYLSNPKTGNQRIFTGILRSEEPIDYLILKQVLDDN